MDILQIVQRYQQKNMHLWKDNFVASWYGHLSQKQSSNFLPALRGEKERLLVGQLTILLTQICPQENFRSVWIIYLSIYLHWTSAWGGIYSRQIIISNKEGAFKFNWGWKTYALEFKQFRRNTIFTKLTEKNRWTTLHDYARIVNSWRLINFGPYRVPTFIQEHDNQILEQRDNII